MKAITLIGSGVMLCMSGAAAASEVGIRAGFSGAWYSPEQSGHGYHIEIIEGRKAVLYWYTYDEEGEQRWLAGVGDIHGNKIEAEMYRFSGGRPPGSWGQAAVDGELWGTLRLVAQDCNAASVSWESGEEGFGAGSLDIWRLTSLQGLECQRSKVPTMELSFAGTDDQFAPLFARYPASADLSAYDLTFEQTQLPQPLDDLQGIKLAGSNRSAQLAMLVYRPITGLVPGQAYDIDLAADLATDVPRGCVGIGASPGEGVSVKLGVTSQPPGVEGADNAPNFDYGDHLSSGSDAVVVGDVTNGQRCEDLGSTRGEPSWQLKTLKSQSGQLSGVADNDGRLWLVAGTASGFEGRTEVYITEIRVQLHEKP